MFVRLPTPYIDFHVFAILEINLFIFFIIFLYFMFFLNSVTRLVCAPECQNTRCRGPTREECCDKECSSGCVGPTDRDCSVKNWVSLIAIRFIIFRFIMS